LAIRIHNDCELGVKGSEVNTGGDYVELLDELGQVGKTKRTVLVLAGQDSGVTYLMLK